MMKAAEELFHSIRQVLAGRQLVSNAIKFRALCFGAGLVHMVFCLCMGIMGAYILCVYNVFIVYAYFFMGIVMARKMMYRQILTLTFVEIEVHSALASLMLGLDWNFMLYTVALVVAAFYFSNSMSNRGKHMWYSVLLASLVIVVYFAVVLVEPHFKPYYDTSAYESVKSGISYLNIIIAFGLQLILAILFAFETRYMELLLQKENIKLGEEANLDPLTKLMNRRSLNYSITDELEKERDMIYSIVMMDIDDFKKINDLYGHDSGDNVLIKLADIISHETREEDYSCRWGGEEFLLFVHGTKEESYFVAERIREMLQEASFKDKHGSVFGVTATMGISDNRSDKPFRIVVQEADDKLYMGKRNGKNQVIV
ncbi:MAG: GGDEF domain-containing protein [Lachnospiraceae bacterium]|nr:GGDEF domain-containing protein [Lachnospiraceae bacterium]